MALKNVSIEVSFKYRYAQPSMHYTFANTGDLNFPPDQPIDSININPPFHLLSGQVGVAYHF